MASQGCRLPWGWRSQSKIRQWSGQPAVDAHKGLAAVGNVLTQEILTEGGAVVIEASPFRPLTAAKNAALSDAADRYGEFLGVPAVLLQA